MPCWARSKSLKRFKFGFVVQWSPGLLGGAQRREGLAFFAVASRPCTMTECIERFSSGGERDRAIINMERSEWLIRRRCPLDDEFFRRGCGERLRRGVRNVSYIFLRESD